MKAPNVNILIARLLIGELIRQGISLFCLSPGSRSTPLVIAAVEHPGCKVRVFHDERSAGYFAVGYARGNGNPAALICTSGTAVANYYPSVIEAYQSRLPLVVLSADRPEELQNCGAPQTINQENIFGSYAVGTMTIAAPHGGTDPLSILAGLSESLREIANGPIHINCRFREPLAPTKEDFDSDGMWEKVSHWYAERINHHPTNPIPDLSSVEEVASLINSSDSGLIVAAPQPAYKVCRELLLLANLLNWPLVGDILSQQRFGSRGAVLGQYDLYLDREDAAELLSPDLILHVGGLPTSKRLNQFLQRHKSIEYIKLQNHHRTIDPDRLETIRIITDPDIFIQQLIPRLMTRPDKEFLNKWRNMEKKSVTFLKDHFSDDRLTESSLAYRISQIMVDGWAIFLSNGMPVRDADTFFVSSSNDIIVGANRGANGIDGIISSACGYASGCRRPTTLIIGDLAFVHDLNSLRIAALSEYPIIIIVINNDGGGLFHFLPIVEFGGVFEDYFGAPHGLEFEKAASMFNLPYHKPITVGEFESVYQKLNKKGQSAVIEVSSDRVINKTEHDALRARFHEFLTA